ncbi:MAG: preprotein translocase subunit SecY [Ignavibacteriales bacterium]
MFQTLVNAWKIMDLRRKILFTIGMLLVFRIGSFIPVPGLNSEVMGKIIGEGGDLVGLLDSIGGGALKNLSLFAMSITPYINASIIMQLLTIAIPSLEKLAKEGEEGRKIIAQYTRYGTVVLALIQAIGLYASLAYGGAVYDPNWLTAITVILTFTAGTAFLMWLGEQITEFGIGNGISLLIFAGIVSRVPSAMVYLFQKAGSDILMWLLVIVLLVFMFAAIAGVVWVQLAERRIPVQYAKRVVGRKMYGGQSTHIPIKVAMAGVIPIIFAMSIMMFPATIMRFANPNPTGFWLWVSNNIFSPSSAVYALFNALLIVGFTFFYTFVIFNHVEIANNLKKNGGFIPGIRSGKPTADYIKNVLNRVTIFGGLFLAMISVLPYLIQWVTPFGNIYFGGTALLIVVGVAMDTVKQLESQMLMRHYKGFLE